MTSIGRQALMEHKLLLEKNVDVRRLLSEDLRWKTTFDGRQPLMMTFDERQPLMEDAI